MKQPAVYIMANRKQGTLYTGVTSNLYQRVYQHKESKVGGFTKKYACKILVYYELFEKITDAIDREKKIKNGSRSKKICMIESVNADWHDLYETIIL